jgi:hypothetical protein
MASHIGRRKFLAMLGGGVERILGIAAADLAHLKIPTKIKPPCDIELRLGG